MVKGGQKDDVSSMNNYYSWTKAGLIDRVKQLEAELAKRPAPELPEPQAGHDENTPVSTPPRKKRKPDPANYSTRFIALKLAYLGKNYGGYEFQATCTRPTIEDELWQALVKACLIFPKDDRIVDFDSCEYSKCGRTDRGVSAFGQVIALRVRSNRPLPKERVRSAEEIAADSALEKPEGTEEDAPEPKPFDDILDEIPYARTLNRILPEDIRILAWCPSPPPDFSARFSCRERQYKYFFTQPAFSPPPAQLEPSASAAGNITPGWLDIDAMRDAAKRLKGEHDFRNMCKIDPAKLITNFHRRIYETSIEEVKDASTSFAYVKDSRFAPADLDNSDGGYPKVYSVNVRGSAFLWHQIRHIVSVLFLVGQGLESPSIIDDLLDADRYPGRPAYVLADEVPLVLWDCIFPEEGDPERKDSLGWVYVGDDALGAKFGRFAVMDGMWETWRGKKMDELLAGQLLKQFSEQGGQAVEGSMARHSKSKVSPSVRVFGGGNTYHLSGKYVPVLKRVMLQSPEVQNDKYAKRKGYADVEDMKIRRGFRNAKVEAEAETDE